MKTHQFTLTLALAVSLSACAAQPEADSGEAAPDEAETEDGAADEELVSIFRTDVEQPEQAQFQLEALSVVIGFPEGGSQLDAAALTALKEVIESEQFASGASLALGGHSDAGGNDAANERASLARAEAVRDWLVGEGVDEDRISVIAFGEQNPVEPNALPNGEPNEQGRAANRRVEISVVPPKGATTTKPPAKQESAGTGD
jgi:OOP family OmpA-OmpF porin